MLPDQIKNDLDSPVFVHVATLNPDGSPQVSAMWVMREGDRIVLNTAEGRIKWRNLLADPRVAISYTRPGADYEAVSIQGRVVSHTTSDGDAIIDALARKYLGADSYPFRRPDETRVTFRIEVHRVGGYH